MEATEIKNRRREGERGMCHAIEPLSNLKTSPSTHHLATLPCFSAIVTNVLVARHCQSSPIPLRQWRLHTTPSEPIPCRRTMLLPHSNPLCQIHNPNLFLG